MNSRERVLAALSRETPDRVPRCEFAVDRPLAEQLLPVSDLRRDVAADLASRLEQNQYSLGEMNRIASLLQLDNTYYVLRAPIYAERGVGADGRAFYGAGQIQSEDDFDLIRLPDPKNPELYAEAEVFAQGSGERTACFVTRAGIFPAMLSLGIENFGLKLYDEPQLVERVLDVYFDWSLEVAERACRLGFDVYVTTDDMAHKSGPLFSPRVFRELVLPRYRKLRERVTIPWVIHTDGNILPFVDYFVELDVAGLHPIEKGAMDIVAMKQRYADHLCLLGNVDLNILGLGTPADVEDEVRELIRTVGPGGGYICTSGNSLASYLKPENVLALSHAVQKYGAYPIAV